MKHLLSIEKTCLQQCFFFFNLVLWMWACMGGFFYRLTGCTPHLTPMFTITQTVNIDESNFVMMGSLNILIVWILFFSWVLQALFLWTQTSATGWCRLIKAKLQQIIGHLLLADSEQEVRARDLKPVIADPEPAWIKPISFWTSWIWNLFMRLGAEPQSLEAGNL